MTDQKIVEKPLWTREFIALIISNLFLFISFHMLIPTMPAYVALLGGSETAVGLATTVFTLSALAARPLTGRAVDTSGRGPILRLGLLILLAAVSSYYWLPAVIFVLLARLVHGAGFGIATTAYGTIVSDMVPPRRRGEGMGYYGLSHTVSLALAPLIGIALMQAAGFGTLFLISTVLALVAILFTRLVPAEDASSTKQAGNTGVMLTPPRNQGLLEKRAFFPAFLMFCLAFAHGGIVGFITLFGQEVRIENVGWFFFAMSIMVTLVRPAAGVLFDRKGHVWVLMPGTFFTAAGVLLLSYAESTAGLVLASIFYGIGFGAIQPSLQAWTINRVEASRRGAANATYFSAIDLGIGAGAIVLGLVASYTGFAVMYRWSVLILLVYLAAYVAYLTRQKTRDLPAANS